MAVLGAAWEPIVGPLSPRATTSLNRATGVPGDGGHTPGGHLDAGIFMKGFRASLQLSPHGRFQCGPEADY